MRSDHPLICNLRWKLRESVEHLATGPGTLKARLKNVLISHLIGLCYGKTSSEVEMLITEAVALATSKEDETGKAGNLHVTLSTSSWRKDREIAEKIFEAYELASKEYHQAEKA